jgi:GT2 family glycosyltransferase
MSVARSQFGTVVIGRNEGERLKRCLFSASEAALVIYVDSGSTDESVTWTKDHGFIVIELDTNIMFTAARARNAGFSYLRKAAPNIEFVQFVDGDCEMNQGWPSTATSFLNTHHDVCAVFGRRRERYPGRSIYNRLCDSEWDVPVGEARAFGGDVMIRTAALEGAGGYRDDFIAGEEPELCVRLRAAGWQIWRLDCEMTLHDAAMTRFSQWWLRTVRSGYAFAQGAAVHGALPERHWVWESRRAVLWGMLLPLTCVMALVAFGAWGFAAWLVYPLQIARRMARQKGPLRRRAEISGFELLARFPESMGLLRFLRDRMLRRIGPLIEYK